MNCKLTIYTPINSNYENLDIIYNSLLSQSNKQFTWYIIDYNQSEAAASYVSRFKSENKLKVEYLYKYFKGRYLVTRFAFENINTNYILGLDGAYYIVDDCVETVLRHWQKIENEKNNDIAEIRGLAAESTGVLVGNSTYHYNGEYADMYWQQMVLKNKNFFEMLASWDRVKFLESVNFNNYQLYADQIDELSTTLFWSSIGRKYQTRYLNKILKCKIDSQTTQQKSTNIYNNFVSSYYFLTENIKYFFYSPKYFTGVISSFINSGLKLQLGLNELLKLNGSMKYKSILISYYWPIVVLKIIK